MYEMPTTRQSDSELRVARHFPVLIQQVGDNFSIARQAHIRRQSANVAALKEADVPGIGACSLLTAAPTRWEVSGGGPPNPIAVLEGLPGSGPGGRP